jgi:hypothetical protein
MGAAARMRLLMSAPGPVRMERAERIASSARGSDAAEIAREFGDELLRICADTDNARFARVLTVQLGVGRADAPPLPMRSVLCRSQRFADMLLSCACCWTRGTSRFAPGVRTGTGGPLCTLHVLVGMWRSSTYCWRAALE